MYAIEIESPKFKGLTVIKQHKLVNQVLKEEIAQSLREIGLGRSKYAA